MRSILFLDPSIGTGNLGDQIIAACVRDEMRFLTKGHFVYELPTHVPCFHAYQVWRNSYAVRTYADCAYKFVSGSNLLVKDMRTHYPQWNINRFNCGPLGGCVLIGVGAGAGERTNGYTRRLYRGLLNDTLYHSVRDERSKRYVESLGLKALNTACASLWALTPAFCAGIPSRKADRVIFTLTGTRSGANPEDQRLIDILTRSYEHVHFFPQGDLDLDYFARFDQTARIDILPPSLPAYEAFLAAHETDYVGTRLHGGILAMRHKKRAVILAIDERAREIRLGNKINCIERSELGELEAMLHGPIHTQIELPQEAIRAWKAQFEGAEFEEARA